MVFVKREIPPVHRLNKPELADVPPAKVAQVTNQANLAGIITQMAQLTSYANEMFTSLISEATETFTRIKSLSERAERLNTAALKVETYFGGNQAQILQSMNNSGRAEFTAQNPEEHQHLTVQSRPPAVVAVYGGCAPPPALQLLDSCAEDGKPCLVKYTHPQFFFEKWIEEQQKQVELLKAERKKRREERAAKRANQKDNAGPAKVIRKLRKVRYDPETGQKIIEEEEETVAVSQGTGGGQSFVSADTPAPAASSDKREKDSKSSKKDKDSKTSKSKGDRKSKSKAEANPNAGSGMMPGTFSLVFLSFRQFSSRNLIFFRCRYPSPSFVSGSCCASLAAPSCSCCL